MELKTLIIDDEKPSRENLRAIISEYFPDLNVVGEADDLELAKCLILKENPDLLLLDIELGQSTGLEFLENFENPDFEVIFVTAYEDYATRAFRTVATDYLLKPIDIDEFSEAILKVKHRIDYRNLKNESQNILNQKEKSSQLKIYTIEGIRLINIDDIVYLTSLNYYTKIVHKNKTEIISSKHLKDFEEQLKNYQFYRIHNSFIINLDYLESVTTNKGIFVQLVNSITIKISRRRQDDFLKYLESR